MTIGFIGTGVISEAMIRGLSDVAGYTDQIMVSKRSFDRSKRLSEAYSNITICETNTEVVDQSDWVFVGVLPDQVAMVLQALPFKTTQKVISLVAGVGLKDLKRYLYPCEDVIRAIPMPPIEFGKGPLAICPSDDAFETFANK
ncbi:MAG: NAD(P)-binding domain-containing protein, partial [Proteobacteria bacterium]|nr:NAD(P)-binding domain-containing protein [Pseudomonadota bacterium]